MKRLIPLALALLLAACPDPVDDIGPDPFEAPGTPFDDQLRVGMTTTEITAEFGEPKQELDSFQLRTLLGDEVAPGTGAYQFLLSRPAPAEGESTHMLLTVFHREGKVVSWFGKPCGSLGF